MKCTNICTYIHICAWRYIDYEILWYGYLFFFLKMSRISSPILVSSFTAWLKSNCFWALTAQWTTALVFQITLICKSGMCILSSVAFIHSTSLHNNPFSVGITIDIIDINILYRWWKYHNSKISCSNSNTILQPKIFQSTI